MIGTTAYVDYYYNLSSPSEQQEDLNGFTYRRLFLTADFRIDDAFSSRVRLEANDGTTQSFGPVPFVKDLYLRWTSPGGHQITGGVQAPPAFEATETVWGFRSLEKTVLDLFGVVNSRDFGIRFNGPITGDGRLRYAAMLANNESVRPEDDKHKRIYAQLETRPTDRLVFTAGGDYATYADERDGALRLSGMAGYVADRFAVGAEAFRYGVQFAGDEASTMLGLSLFARGAIAADWQLVGRVDRVRNEPVVGSDQSMTFFVAGVAYAPRPGIRLIPNIHVLHEDGQDDSAVMGRFTLEVNL